MNNTELRALLENNVYVIKQHISLLTNDTEKALPIRVYTENLKAINDIELAQAQSIKDNKLLNDINTNEQDTNAPALSNASVLLIEYGLLVDNQVRHYKNRPLIEKCNEFINSYGLDRFKNVLARIKAYKDKGIKIGNMQGYINRALDNELKQGAKDERA